MKKIVLFCAVLFTALFATTSCNKDNDSYYVVNYPSWESYGISESPTEDGYAVIRRDDGAKLIIVHSQLNNFNPAIGQRVIVNYDIVKDVSKENVFEKTYQIAINNAETILTKGLIKQSFIDEDELNIADSLGNDPIYDINKAWFSGKFLNINLSFLNNPGVSVPHMISLVYDDDDVELDSDGTVVLTLHHNAYRDTIANYSRVAPVSKNAIGSDKLYSVSARTAFDISSIVPEGETSVNIILKWLEYDDDLEGTEKKSSKATFRLPQVNESKSANDDGDNIIVDGSELGLDKVATKVE